MGEGTRTGLERGLGLWTPGPRPGPCQLFPLVIFGACAHFGQPRPSWDVQGPLNSTKPQETTRGTRSGVVGIFVLWRLFCFPGGRVTLNEGRVPSRAPVASFHRSDRLAWCA